MQFYRIEKPLFVIGFHPVSPLLTVPWWVEESELRGISPNKRPHTM